MARSWRKRFTIAALLVAAFATYVDAPRLNIALNLGDTLNAVRVMDPMQHTRMQQLLDALTLHGDGNELANDLQDGNESLELLSNNITLNAVVAPMFRLVEPVTLEGDGFALGEQGDTQPLTGLAGALFHLDLPPPTYETLWQPPRTELPTSFNFSHTARAPPIALR